MPEVTKSTTLDNAGTTPAAAVAPAHRHSPLGTLISTVSAFLGIVLIPIGLLYVVDLTAQGAAMSVAGVLLIIATMRYIATDTPRFAAALIASGLALGILTAVAVMAWGQVAALTDQQWQAFAQVERTRLAGDTDVAWLSFMKTASTLAAGISLVLCLWILTRLLTQLSRGTK